MVDQVARTFTIELPENLYIRLQHTAQATRQSIESLVLHALQVGSLALIDQLDKEAERRSWSSLSDASLQRVWDNEADARYDRP